MPAPYIDIVVPDSTLPSTIGNFELYGSFFTPTMTVVFTSQTVNYFNFHNSNWITVNVTTGATEGLFSIVLNNGISRTFNNAYQVILGTILIPTASDWNSLVYADVTTNGTLKMQYSGLKAEGKLNTSFFTIPASGFFRFLWSYNKSPYHPTPIGASTNRRLYFKKVSDNSIFCYISIWISSASTCDVTAHYGDGTLIGYIGPASTYADTVFSLRRTGSLMQFFMNDTMKFIITDPSVEMKVEIDMLGLDIIGIKGIL